uniref:Uncharacterized protein n=1 Tax=Romanomermis culicivorax TaxID=13658 RepID=A0A915HFS6_ROMCU
MAPFDRRRYRPTKLQRDHTGRSTIAQIVRRFGPLFRRNFQFRRRKQFKTTAGYG